MKRMIVLILTVLLLSSCGNRVSVQPRSSKQVVEEEASFIDLVEITPTIVMDKNTGVLYVREEQYIQSNWICTTFPIMEEDGTCLTYKEAQARGKLK